MLILARALFFVPQSQIALHWAILAWCFMVPSHDPLEAVGVAKGSRHAGLGCNVDSMGSAVVFLCQLSDCTSCVEVTMLDYAILLGR